MTIVGKRAKIIGEGQKYRLEFVTIYISLQTNKMQMDQHTS